MSKGNDTSDTLQTLCSPRLKREANDVGRKEEAVGSWVEEVREEGKGKRENGKGKRDEGGGWTLVGDRELGKDFGKITAKLQLAGATEFPC